MVNPAVDLKTEDELFAKEVEEVKRWWSDSRWRNTKRPFTAEQIVSKRGNLKIDYPSNAQSKKLWDILEGRFKVGHWLLLSIEGLLQLSVPEEAGIETREAHPQYRVEPRCELHLRLLGTHNGHADGQIPRHRLCLWMAVVLNSVRLR